MKNSRGSGWKCLKNEVIFIGLRHKWIYDEVSEIIASNYWRGGGGIVPTSWRLLRRIRETPLSLDRLKKWPRQGMRKVGFRMPQMDLLDGRDRSQWILSTQYIVHRDIYIHSMLLPLRTRNKKWRKSEGFSLQWRVFHSTRLIPISWGRSRLHVYEFH